MVKMDKILDRLKNNMDIFRARKLDYLREKETRSCLATSPNNVCGTILSAVEFRDELRDRYGFGILNALSHYDCCGSKCSMTHVLSCKKGGLMHARHDNISDLLVYLSCAQFQPSNVRDEPKINPYHAIGGKDERKEGGKLVESNLGMEMQINVDRGDLLIRGFWDRNTDCIIDVRIYDVNQASYRTRKRA